MELRRHALLARIESVRPKVLALVAPAGFGKTTLSRQYTYERGASAVCDCRDIRDDLDLARRLIPAIAATSPDREQTLRQRELMLGDGSTTVAMRVNLALEAWREPANDTIVFENAEALAGCPPARDFFARLLAWRPPGRTIVICSREGLRMHLTRFAAPHEILALHAQDLAFDANEMQELFAMHFDDAQSIDRIMAVSQGWPIAVLLLKRFASEGRLHSLLDRLNDVAFEELHDYLVDEVLASAGENLKNAFFAIACIPRAAVADLRAVGVDRATIHEVEEFAKASAFIRRHRDGSLTVHPLLESLLLEEYEEQRDGLLRNLAAHYEQERDFERAAELHLARGDQLAAAQALGQHEVMRDRSPSMQYARVLASLDHELTQRFPRLWSVTALLRMYCASTEKLLDEAQSLWRTLPSEVPPLERFYILVFRVIFMSYVGVLEHALAAVDEFAKSVSVNDPPQTPLDAYMLYLRGVVLARIGRFGEAERDLTASLSVVEGTDAMASGGYITLAVDIARVRGERAVERELLERALERNRSSGLDNLVAFAVAEALIGAWFAGEHDAAAQYALQLDEAVQRHGTYGFGYLAASARGRTTVPTERDMPKYVMFGRLMAIGHASDKEAAQRLAHAALAVAQQHHAPFDETLASIAVALTDDAAFEEHIDAAREIARRCESPALHSAVDAIANRSPEVGILAPFVAEISRDRPKRKPPVEIEIVRGRVAVDGKPIAVGGREGELLFAIALQREPTPRDQLIEMLWPDIDEYAARNSFNVCLHKLRQRLGRDDLIVHEEDGYRLHAEAAVDLWEIERVSALLHGHRRIGDAQRAWLTRTWNDLRRALPGRMRGWEWFAPTERRLGQLRIEIGQRLASDALSAGDGDAALSFATDMIQYDPCDEPARELAIRANLLMGDRAAAIRQFRQYRQTLQTELQCEPSPALAAMLSA